VAGPLFWCRLVTVILSCVFIVLMWVIVFVGSQRLLFGQIILPQRPQHNSPFLGFFNYFEIDCPENVRNHAKSYLLRIVALTNANKSRYEETCFFVPNQGMPSAEQIATALLMRVFHPSNAPDISVAHMECDSRSHR
jgi:hypothetical protein